MASLKDLLPPAKSTATTFYDHSNDPWFKNRFTESESKAVPVYLKRQGFRPRNPEDFGDGGAFPEIHVAQYPLGMGKNISYKPGSKTLPVTVDAQGNVVFDAIVRQNENEGDLDGVVDEEEELQKQIQETTEETKAAMEQSGDSKYIKYKPSQQSSAFNSGAKERIIRMASLKDLLPPAKSTAPVMIRVSVPKSDGEGREVIVITVKSLSESVASLKEKIAAVIQTPANHIMKLSGKEWFLKHDKSLAENNVGAGETLKLSWLMTRWRETGRIRTQKVPWRIERWLESIPLGARLDAEQKSPDQFRDTFARLNEIFLQGSRLELHMMTKGKERKVQEEIRTKYIETEMQELRVLIEKVRSERTGAPASMPVSSDRARSESVDPRGDYDYDYDRERERERERERSYEAKDASMGKKSKITRDGDRDISEKVALGMGSTGAKGMDSGLATDDQYNVYDKGLFTARPALSTLYKPKQHTDEEMYGNADEQFDKLKNTVRFNPDKAFTGASKRAGKRERPVDFEKEEQENLSAPSLILSQPKKNTRIDSLKDLVFFCN